MQEFFVANFRVDMKRNHIVHEGDVIALEPKVLEVLCVLADNPGEVVSHQQILNRVWPDRVVEANALQRCIAQLRKAFNDDAKTQGVIVTHPKKGYSLEAEVSLRTDLLGSTSLNQRSNPTYKRAAITLLWSVAVPVVSFLVVAILAVNFVLPRLEDQQALGQFNQLTPLTTTDKSEFYSTFSPDGRYVAFSRQADTAGNQFWLKDLHNNQEFRVSKQAGIYGQPSWSTDGKRLAFVDLRTCKPAGCGNNTCYSIKSLFIPLAKTEPQAAKTLVDCVDIPHQGLQWVSDNELAFIETQEMQSKISVFDINTKTQRIIFQSENTKAYSLSYSSKNNQLAVMQESTLLMQDLFLLSPVSGETESLPISFPVRYGSWTRWYPVWNAKGDGFLFSAANRLYQVDLKGNLEESTIPTFQDISRPMFHPQGDSIAMTLGKVDRDIFEIEWLSQQSADTAGQMAKLSEKVVARSILREGNAQYQPNGNAIAFFSERGGSRQLWLKDGDHLTQLSNFEPSLSLELFVWSPNGKQLALLTEKQLFLSDVNGDIQSIDLNFRAIKLFQWTQDDRLLMSIIDDKKVRLISFDINSGQYITHYQGQARWAQIYHDRVILTEKSLKVQQLEEGVKNEIAELAEIDTWSRFYVRGNRLFLLSTDDYFWSYDFIKKEQVMLFHYDDSSIAISDIHPDKSKVLVSRHVSARKEIVLLHQSK